MSHIFYLIHKKEKIQSQYLQFYDKHYGTFTFKITTWNNTNCNS